MSCSPVRELIAHTTNVPTHPPSVTGANGVLKVYDSNHNAAREINFGERNGSIRRISFSGEHTVSIITDTGIYNGRLGAGNESASFDCIYKVCV